MISSASSLSWCASAGLEVVTSKTPERSSTSSHNPAGSEPITVRNAEATWPPSRRLPPGCRRSTRGRILPSLSTGQDLAARHVPDACDGDELGRKRPRFDRRDDHLALASYLPQKSASPLAVKLRQDIVQQEHRPLTSALGDHCG